MKADSGASRPAWQVVLQLIDEGRLSRDGGKEILRQLGYSEQDLAIIEKNLAIIEKANYIIAEKASYTEDHMWQGQCSARSNLFVRD